MRIRLKRQTVVISILVVILVGVFLINLVVDRRAETALSNFERANGGALRGEYVLVEMAPNALGLLDFSSGSLVEGPVVIRFTVGDVYEHDEIFEVRNARAVQLSGGPIDNLRIWFSRLL